MLAAAAAAASGVIKYFTMHATFTSVCPGDESLPKGEPKPEEAENETEEGGDNISHGK